MAATVEPPRAQLRRHQQSQRGQPAPPLVAQSCAHHYTRTSIGGPNMQERTPNPDTEETAERKREAGDATAGSAGSAAEEAKEQERAMEESGEENAA
jgi:hypothetical protein